MTDSPNTHFRIPGVAEIITGQGGLPALSILPSEASHGSAATIYFHGAHVAAFQPRDAEEVLWLSAKSMWQADKPIRGGVPLCFPWFGPHPTLSSQPTHPAHGFARLRPWTLDSLDTSDEGITAGFSLKSDPSTLALWPHEFLLRHFVTVGKTLSMSLSLTNTGSAPLSADEAQHTYFSVADVRQVRISGLAGTRYLDKTDGAKEKTQQGDISITAETDRVYLDTETAIDIDDPLKRRRITVRKENSKNTVVWNPWIAKAKAMPDFGDEEWPAMLCVETCNVGASAIALAPGGTQVMTTQIQVLPL